MYSKLLVEPYRQLGIAARRHESAHLEHPDAAIQRDRDDIAAFDLTARCFDPRAIHPHVPGNRKRCGRDARSYHPGVP
jgi:hypothetical protein